MKEQQSMRILCYGGLGYIGTSLIPELLKQKHQVICVDNLVHNQGNLIYPHTKDWNVVIGDACSKLNLLIEFRPQIIINLAAYVGAPLCDLFPQEATNINESFSKELVDKCKELPYRPLILYPNTNSGYGETSEDMVCTEETPLNSISLYGKTKENAERYIRENYDNYLIFRLATVFGYSNRPRLDLLFNTLCYDAYFDKKIGVFEGNFRRNFIHIKDVVSAFMYGIDHIADMRNKVYNIGNDELNITKYKLVDFIAQKTNVKTFVLNKADKDKRNYMVSNALITKAGWKPKYDFEYGLNEMFKFFSYLPTNTLDRSIAITGMGNV